MKAELRQQPKIYNDPLVSSRDSFFCVLVDQYVGKEIFKFRLLGLECFTLLLCAILKTPKPFNSSAPYSNIF